MMFEPCYTVRYARPLPGDLFLLLNRRGQVLLAAVPEVPWGVPEASQLGSAAKHEALLLGSLGSKLCYGAVADEAEPPRPPVAWT